ncbi:MAG: hypothetical protein E7298_14550, partial [Lachnospiraceae bacterium]|nr:hypothetical protein [Lachnospiraceae bacterium]
MKHKSRTKALSWLLSLALMLSLLPGMGLTAYAIGEKAYAAYVPTENDDADALAEKVVKFNGYDWYLIEDNSTSEAEGNVTLLNADNKFGLSAFSDDNNNDSYSSSKIKTALDAMTADDGDFAAVKDAIADTDLADVSVTGAKLYLLSKTEAESLPVNVRKYDSSWWLRGPAQFGQPRFVTGNDGSNGSSNANIQNGVRPALKLDLSKVTFDSGTKTFALAATSPAHTHNDITFTEWTSNNSLPTTAGSYYLTSDVTLSGTWTVPSGNTNLCLNGKTVAGIFSDGSEAVIKVGNSSTLNLYDDGEGKIISKDYEQGSNPISVAVVDCSGTFIMNGGTLSSIEEKELTQGVTLAGDGSFTMNGGTIESVFRGVSVWNSTDQFTMNSGTIRNCKVYGVSNDGSFTMTGGTITGNYNGVCVDEGGVVYLSGAPEISKNGSNEKNVNLMIYSGAVQVAGPLTSTIPIGVGIMKSVSEFETVYTGVFTTGSTNTLKASDYADRFTSDNSAYVVLTEGNELKLAQAPVASVTSSSGAATNYTDFAAAVTAWSSAGNGATLKLLADVETESGITVNSGYSNLMILDLNGYGIRHTGTSGSVISVGNDGRLKLTDSDTSSRKHYITLDENGRGISVADSGTPGDSCVEVTGGYITGGLGRNTGGTYTMGGGVYSNSGFTMEGGTIIGNTVSPSSGDGKGGGVYAGIGTVTMTGGTITRNRASTSGGGVYVPNGSTFKLSGNAVIKDNLKGSDKSNVYLEDTRKITVTGALTNSDPIGVTMQTPGVFTEGGKAKDYAANFTSDDPAYSVMVDGDELKLAQEPVASVTPSGGSATEYPSLSDALAAWTEDGSTLKLLADVETSDTISVSGVKTLDLNGHGVMYTGSNGSVVTVAENATLTLADSDTATTHYITLDANGRGMAVSDTASDGAIKVTGGYITGGLGSKEYSGGPIQGAGVFVSGSFTMEGGSIVGNTAKGDENGDGEGGGVYVVNNSAFTMNGGTITANTAKGDENGDGYGGGVYVGNDSTFTMNGGTITANTAKGGENGNGQGGGVYFVTSGAFTMNDGTISGNTASTDGGGVYVTNDCTFTMNDGAVSGNTANNEGGGVYVSNSSTFSMNDGTVTGNTASTNGGGVYVHGGDSYHYNPQYARNPAQFEVSGGVTIKDNMDTAATPAASNVYLGIDKDSNHDPDYDAKITVTGALTNSDPIGVTMQTPGVFTEGGKAKDYAANFTSDNT